MAFRLYRPRALLLALPVAVAAALLTAAPLWAQTPPAKAEPKAEKADPAEQKADTDSRPAQDAERRKPKRDGERKPLPQREREEEDDRR